jgi:hypothetical protein
MLNHIGPSMGAAATPQAFGNRGLSRELRLEQRRIMAELFADIKQVKQSEDPFLAVRPHKRPGSQDKQPLLTNETLMTLSTLSTVTDASGKSKSNALAPSTIQQHWRAWLKNPMEYLKGTSAKASHFPYNQG